jgi:membrane protein YqaA with SNARE-associated domain
MNNNKLLLLNALIVLFMAFVCFVLFVHLKDFTNRYFPFCNAFVCSILGGMVGYLLGEERFNRLFLVIFIFLIIIVLLNIFHVVSNNFNIKVVLLEWFFSSFCFLFIYSRTKIKKRLEKEI